MKGGPVLGVRPCWLTGNRDTLRLIMPAVLLIIFLLITPVLFVWLRRGEIAPPSPASAA